MGEAGPHGLQCEKWCVPESGNEDHGSWLRTRVRWLRKGDVIRIIRDGVTKEKPTYVVIADRAHWSAAHKCWDVHMNIHER